MRHIIASVALVLVSLAPAGAAGPDLKTEEQKTFYALGLALGQNLGGFALSASELQLVQAGIADAVLRHPQRVDLQVYGPKLKALQHTRATAVAAAERKAGQAFADKVLGDKNTTKTASGLVITTLKPGTGPTPAATDKVKVHYTGTLIDGTVFDSSVQRGEPVTFPLNGVIKCWSEGVSMMKVGGKSRFVCPPELAYGDRGAPPRINPGATLVFEVELLDIVK